MGVYVLVVLPVSLFIVVMVTVGVSLVDLSTIAVDLLRPLADALHKVLNECPK